MPAHTELLQHQDLKPVKPVAVETISENSLKTTYALCENLCNLGGWGSIAVNEIPLPLWQEETGLKDHLPAIFLRPNVNFPEKGTFKTDVLIINPTYTFRGVPTRKTTLEGCGSLDYGNLLYFYARPLKFTIHGYIYTPHKNVPVLKSVNSGYFFDDLVEHEIKHLNEGATAASSPVWISDPFTPHGIKEIIKDSYSNIGEKGMMKLLKEKDRNLLVNSPNNEDKLCIVSPEGNYISDFPTPPSSPAPLSK